MDNQHVSIHLRKSGEEDKTDWFQEAATLSRLKHANIIKFYGILKDDLCVRNFRIKSEVKNKFNVIT